MSLRNDEQPRRMPRQQRSNSRLLPQLQVREKMINYMVKTFSPAIEPDVISMVLEDCHWECK